MVLRVRRQTVFYGVSEAQRCLGQGLHTQGKGREVKSLGHPLEKARSFMFAHKQTFSVCNFYLVVTVNLPVNTAE
jgi:hypothetical protein